MIVTPQDLVEPLHFLEDYLPRCAHILIDQSKYSEVQFKGNTKALIAQLLMKSAFHGNLEKTLRLLEELFPKIPLTGGIDYQFLFIRYFLDTHPDEIEHIVQLSQHSIKENIMTQLEQYIEKGIPKESIMLPTTQLDLFKINQPDGKDYSHLLDFYDSVPKYEYDKKAKETTEIKVKEFKYQEETYQAAISPAALLDEKGKTRHVLPGLREELIEDAVRKRACDNALKAQESEKDQVGVDFTLFWLRQELGKSGHHFTIGELKEGILICNGSILKVTRETNGKKNIVSAPLFTAVGLQSADNWKGHGEKDKCHVRFNPLVTRDIDQKRFRQYNYQICMNYRKPLCRWIHKLLFRRFRQAEYHGQPYSFRSSTFIDNSPFKRYAKLTDNAIRVETALKSMIYDLKTNPDGILEKYERTRRVPDPKFTLYPSRKFAQEVHRSNGIYAELTKEERQQQERMERQQNMKRIGSLKQKLFPLNDTTK